MDIKSYPGGITLILDSEPPFDKVLADAAARFRDAKRFFGNAPLALRIEGRSLTREEEDAVIAVIRRETDVQIRCILRTEGEDEKLFVRALRQEGDLPGDPRPDLRMMHVRQGSLEEGETLEETRPLLLVGDVPASAQIRCGSFAVILGRLSGRLQCGGSFAYIRELDSNKVTIGETAWRDDSSGLQKLFRRRGDCLLVLEDGAVRRLDVEETDAWLTQAAVQLFGIRSEEEELV